MSSTAQDEQSSDTAMLDRKDDQRTATATPPTQHANAKPEARQPVLLQWKDREMADDLSKLMMGSTTPSKHQAN